MGFKDAALPMKEQALAKRTADLVGEQMRRALAEDRLIRAGKIPEPFTPESLAAGS